MQHLEEQIAHLTRTVEELNTVVIRQQGEIDRLTRRVEMLLQREAERGAGRIGRGRARRRTPAALLRFDGWRTTRAPSPVCGFLRL